MLKPIPKKENKGVCKLWCTHKLSQSGNFNTCSILIHHGRFLETIFWWIYVINDGLYPNLSIYYEIGAHINNLLVQQSIF